MNGQELMLNRFQQGEILFLCHTLVAFRSCRKLVRTKLTNIKDNLVEQNFKDDTYPIVFYIANQELYAETYTAVFKPYCQYIELTREVYKDLMDNVIVEQKMSEENDMSYIYSDRLGTTSLENCSWTDGIATTTGYVQSATSWLEERIKELEDKSLVTSVRLSELEEENKPMDINKINSMLEGYKKLIQDNLSNDKNKAMNAIRENDASHKVCASIKEKMMPIIDKLVKSNEITEEECKIWKEWYADQIDCIESHADMQDIFTNKTNEALKEIEAEYYDNLHELQDKLNEVKLRISFVENYEQAIEVLEAYDIIDRFGMFIKD